MKKEKPYYTIVTEENKDILAKWRWGENTEYKFNDNKLVGWCKNSSSDFEKGHNPINIIKGDSYDFGEYVSFEEFCKLENITIPEYLNKYKLELW